jgi:Flp pilus assembly protein TadD
MRLLRTASLAAVILPLVLSACATAPEATPQELALAERLGSKDIVPADPAVIASMADKDPFTRLEFWQAEYDKNPADAAAGVELAKTYRQLRRHGEAVRLANKLAALHPENADVLRILGASLIADNRAAAAVKPLTRAHDIASDNADVLSLLGVAHDNIGEHAKAREQYRKAIKVTPDHRNAQVNLAVSFLLDGKPEFAETVLRDVATRRGANPTIRQNLALALALQGKYSEAEALAQQDLDASAARESVAAVRTMMDAQKASWDVQVETAAKPADSASSPTATTTEQPDRAAIVSQLLRRG